MIAVVDVPIRTSSGNEVRREHWRTTAAKAKKQRHACEFALRAEAAACGQALQAATGGAATVTLTRRSAGKLDAHDNLRTSLKYVADSVAAFLACDDADPRITWQYGQELSKRGDFGVRIQIETSTAVDSVGGGP